VAYILKSILCIKKKKKLYNNSKIFILGRDVNVEEARWALHCLVIYANEVGQPKGQMLEDSSVC
jgi:hypothetical protein